MLILHYGKLIAVRQWATNLVYRQQDRLLCGYGGGVAQQRRLVRAVEAIRLAIANQIAGDAAATGALEGVSWALDVSAQFDRFVIAIYISAVVLAIAQILALLNAYARRAFDLLVPRGNKSIF